MRDTSNQSDDLTEGEKTILLRYAPADLAPDYIRALIGTVVTFGPIVFLNPLTWITVILAIGGGIFAALGIQTISKQMSTVSLSNRSIRVQGIRQMEIPWSDLSRVKLKFYAKRRKQREGWMEMTLQSGGAKVTLDQRLPEFEAIAQMTAHAVRKNNIQLDTTSVENFLALGIKSLDES